MILQRPSPPSSLASPTIKPHSFSKSSVPIPSPSTSSNSNRRGILFLDADAKTRAPRVDTGRRRWTAKPGLVPLGAASNPPAAAAASDGDEGGSSSLSFRQLVVRVGEALSMAFPLWVGSACVIALWRPSSFLWVHRNWQISGITITMLGMGMTLTLDDLKAAFLMPKELTAGFVLQYTVMPLSGFVVSKLLKLPSHYAAGLILVACCPGGTASNIVTYLARGNVALSVLMTAVSTFAAVIMTPILTSKLAGQFVAVDPAGLFMSTVQIVLAPVLLGALLNQYCKSLVEVVSPLMPFIAVATVAILCGSAIGQNASAILSSGLQVVLAVCLLHGLGFSFGYMLSRMLGIDVSCSRTISIEVGMQNSVLGVVLAGQHFELDEKLLEGMGHVKHTQLHLAAMCSYTLFKII
ncbi:putative sodium/metabolite cotransporter BASS1, chloroplastic [Cocos nucifera]|uniref:Putative sodium/metabolite cotransporter BASS1, chloroplastic n=1 Tax=Cocos nucifera TaxID=13894 RepID=A0A8K0IBR9_COCNU|nr:putative sodium/metabolite cotransporter BASS1, chloroplastic [Cocos nucifera]